MCYKNMYVQISLGALFLEKKKFILKYIVEGMVQDEITDEKLIVIIEGV